MKLVILAAAIAFALSLAYWLRRDEEIAPEPPLEPWGDMPWWPRWEVSVVKQPPVPSWSSRIKTEVAEVKPWWEAAVLAHVETTATDSDGLTVTASPVSPDAARLMRRYGWSDE